MLRNTPLIAIRNKVVKGAWSDDTAIEALEISASNTLVLVIGHCGRDGLRGILTIMVWLAFLPLPVFATASCGGEPGWAAFEITDTVRHPEQSMYDIGGRSLVLSPQEFGWRIGMQDINGQDIATFAPPMHLVEVKPLNIAGWHFRNQDNSGRNLGDVNAPQHQSQLIRAPGSSWSNETSILA